MKPAQTRAGDKPSTVPIINILYTEEVLLGRSGAMTLAGRGMGSPYRIRVAHVKRKLSLKESQHLALGVEQTTLRGKRLRVHLVLA